MTTVTEVRDAILALTPDERFRLASHLFARSEAQLAHIVIRSGVVDDAAGVSCFPLESEELNEDQVLRLPGVAA